MKATTVRTMKLVVITTVVTLSCMLGLAAGYVYAFDPYLWYCTINLTNYRDVAMMIPASCSDAKSWHANSNPGSEADLWCFGYQRVVVVQKDVDIMETEPVYNGRVRKGTFVTVVWKRD